MLITPQELELHRIVVSKTYAAGEIDYRGAEFKQTGPLEVRAAAELEGQEIRIRGHLKGRIEAPCARCLGRAEIPVNSELDLLYRPMWSIAREEDIEIPRDELEVGFWTGAGILLEDVVAEQVILSLPMKVVCGPDCQGLCPTCGANRNLEACHCVTTPRAESPFASLK